MTTLATAKLVLKNTTKMSLNERFTAYRAQAQIAASSFRHKIKQASSANRKLAQQMPNRPTVIAALRLKKRSLQQRLGNKSGDIKSRLNLGGRYNNVQSRLGNRGRGQFGNRRNNFRPGTSPMLKARLGGNFNRPQTTVNRRQNQRQGFRYRRNNVNQNQQFGGNYRTMQQRQGMRNARGKAGRGRFIKPAFPNLSKQDLDNELDEYMAETKSSYSIYHKL